MSTGGLPQPEWSPCTQGIYDWHIQMRGRLLGGKLVKNLISSLPMPLSPCAICLVHFEHRIEKPDQNVYLCGPPFKNLVIHHSPLEAAHPLDHTLATPFSSKAPTSQRPDIAQGHLCCLEGIKHSRRASSDISFSPLPEHHHPERYRCFRVLTWEYLYH